MYILSIFAGIIAGFILGRATKKTLRPATPEELSKAQQKSRKALSKRTENRKEEIIRMMENGRQRYEDLKACGLEAEQKGIHRSDVEDLLGVSDQTALKYLNELEEEGKIKQIGTSGKNVYYMLAS